MKRKKLRNTCLAFFIVFSSLTYSQEEDVVTRIIENYKKYEEPSLVKRRIKHRDILPLIMKWREHSSFEVKKVGTSIEGRDLNLLSIGSGDTDVFLWSQMHGDESTATMAIFDILNFLNSESFQPEKKELLNKLRLHFLPMLNPDGAELFQRRNALGIDVNRDALRLQSPEGKTLKRVRDSLNADFGFNLHDQSRYYNAEGTPNPATISFLAPAYDYEKSVNEVRGNAMKIIVEMNEVLQKYAEGKVGRYNDDFEPRAFGDNIQKWGTSTILIESGGFPLDPEKQEIRKLNFLAIMTALFSIADQTFRNTDISEYETIPENDNKLFDLKLIGLNYELLGETYILDLGINHSEVSNVDNSNFYYRSRIADQGDLSTNFGYKTVDVTGFKMRPGKIYPEIFENLQALEKLNFDYLLLNGYSYVRVKDLSGKEDHVEHPVQVVRGNFKPQEELQVGIIPTFFLEKDGKLKYAVINGFIVDLSKPGAKIENGLIIR